jgi:hypothetical protein
LEINFDKEKHTKHSLTQSKCWALFACFLTSVYFLLASGFAVAEPKLPEMLITAISSAMKTHPDVLKADSEMLSAKSQVKAGEYPQGEASGDSGAMLNIELLHSITPQVQAILFYDYGQVKINHDNFTQASNERAIAGAGVGVNAKFSGFSLNSYLAWRTQGGIPLSEPSSEERTPRLWFQISREF